MELLARALLPTNNAMIVNQPSECYKYPTISSEKNATITPETKKANY